MRYRKYLSLLFYIQLVSCSAQKQDKIVTSLVYKYKSDWKIAGIDYRWKNFDYYGQPIYDCVMNIHAKSLKRSNSYLIKFLNGKNIMVEIIEFKEQNMAQTVYERTTQYAEKIRTTIRKNVWQLCEPEKEWDFHYVLLSERKLYIIGCINGIFNFKDENASLESDPTNLYEAEEIYKGLKDIIYK